MDKFDISKETNDQIGKVVGTCVGTVVTILLVDTLNKYFGN